MRNKVIITGFRFDSNFKCPYSIKSIPQNSEICPHCKKVLPVY